MIPLVGASSVAQLSGEKVACYLVDNGADAHAVQPYLTAAETGEAIAAGLGLSGPLR
jgi:hypothetical protein